MKRKILAALLVASSVLGASSAMAGTATGTMAVSATLTSDCQITANPLSFGSVSGLLASAVTVSTTVSVTCSNTTPFTVSLNGGTTTGATTTGRMMANGSNTLNYGIYQDSAYTQNWGNTTGTGGDVATGTGTGAAVILTAYGKIPAGQVVVPGTYTDTVTATVAY